MPGIHVRDKRLGVIIIIIILLEYYDVYTLYVPSVTDSDKSRQKFETARIIYKF